MEKEILIKKWLDNELSDEELDKFKQLEEYESFVKLSDRAKFFKAPTYKDEEALKNLQPIIQQKGVRKSMLQRMIPFARIAAVFVLGFFVYSLFFSNDIKKIESVAGVKKVIELPDGSVVNLNAKSVLTYAQKDWPLNREVQLDGEAFFKVAKGSRFDVLTSEGVITVLGTEFNVKVRSNFFEVQCFEGKVRVNSNTILTELPAGSSMRIVNGKLDTAMTSGKRPTWIDDLSSFKSVPFSEVIDEFERQYNVKIIAEFDTTMLFTGSFVHNEKQVALSAITLPFDLSYKLKDNLITLYYQTE